MKPANQHAHDGVSRKSQLVARFEEQIRILSSGLDGGAMTGGISAFEWLMLYHLEQTPGIPLKTLASSVHARMSRASRALQNLVTLGLAEAHRVTGNRRNYAIFVTPHGRTLLEAARPTKRGTTRQAVDGLSEESLAIITRTLDECLWLAEGR